MKRELPLTGWQVAASCLRGCVQAARESLDESEWDAFLADYFEIGAKLGRDRLVRDLRACQEDEE
ncbi:MAG: hypothetical protein H0T97_09875 [Actinobacteria bacterium]|nr:hypothetical protein [Actinomycetota bacterium]